MSGSARAALTFCAGVLVAPLWPGLVAPLSIAVLAAVVATLLCFRRWRWLAALPAGLLWFAAHALWFQATAWPEARAGQSVSFDAVVTGVPDQRDGRARVEFRIDSATGAATSSVTDPDLPARVLLSWYRPLEWFRPGERWQLVAELEPPGGRANPGLFDYHQYLIARGIGGVGRIRAAERAGPAATGAPVDRLRQRFGDWLQAEIADLDGAALARALSVADRSAMAPELADALRRTGTAHLLSISGLHVAMVAGLTGLVAGLLFTPLQAWARGLERRRVVLIAGLAGALGYAALAGFSLPTLRALVMIAAGFGALLWRRSLQPGRALALALLVIVLLDPLAPLAIGFWLSFGAVVVLVWAFAGHRPRRAAHGLVHAQMAVAVGLLALNLGIFQRWAPTAFVLNLVAIPLVGFWVLPALLLALAAFGAGLPAGWAAQAAEAGLGVFTMLLDQAARVDAVLGDSLQPARPAPDWIALVLAMIGGLWLLAPRGWPLRAFGLILLAPLLLPPVDDPRRGEFDLLVPDLGDGQAVVIRTEHHVVLFGTGPGDGGHASLVPGTIAPLVRQAGAIDVDVVIVPDRLLEFSGGLVAAKRQWPRARIVGHAAGAGHDCVAGQGWDFDGVGFRFLHPSAALPDLGSDSGCVLEVRSAAGSALLPAAVGRMVGARLARDARPVDVLLLPRRGHREALDAGWLAAVAPEFAAASVARFGSGGLPHDEVRERLAAAGIRFATTANCGALRFRFRHGATPAAGAELVNRPRFWREPDRCRLR